MPDSGYAFGEDARFEQARLQAVERACDRQTRGALLEAGVSAGWRCWEVGAGRGSIARWMGEAVDPGGHVLATDLEERWSRTAGAANIEFRRHDVARDPVPAGGFDLVHARFLLEHLADPAAALARLATALRPGGVMVLEDSAGLELGVDPPADAFARLAPAWRRAGEGVGWDALYGRALAAEVRAAGLVEVRGVEYRALAPGGEAWEHVASGLARLTPELSEQGVSYHEVARAIALLRDPSHMITGPPVVIVFGRRTAGDPG